MFRIEQLKKFVFLQERDRKLLRWISEQRFATREQLRRVFFPGRGMGELGGDRVCARRLGELCKFGFLEKRHVVTDAVQLYQVGRAGLAELTLREGSALPYLPKIDLKNYEHDVRINECRIALEELGARDWLSERRLVQTGLRGSIPDAIFSLGENRIALELELSLKRLDRYPSIFKRYANERKEVRTIFYLCGTETVERVLARLVGDSRRFYFALWEEFQANPARTAFHNQYDRVTVAELV